MRTAPHIPRSRADAQSGISLILMAMLILVVAIGATAILPNTGQENGDKVRVTLARMQTIKRVMESFNAVDSTRLLPCPAPIRSTTLYKYTDVNGQKEVPLCKNAPASPSTAPFDKLYAITTSKVVGGAVPAATLSLPDRMMIDGWGNKFTYVVDSDVTWKTTYTAGITVIGISSAQPLDMRGRALYDTGTQKPIALLISHGPNQRGSYSGNGIFSTACDTGQTDGDNCYLYSPATATAFNQFVSDRWRADLDYDDIVVPIILSDSTSKKSCFEPTPCAGEQTGTTSIQKNVPEGCVASSVASHDKFPAGWGGNAHNSTRSMTSGSALRCCDGTWTTSGSCP